LIAASAKAQSTAFIHVKECALRLVGTLSSEGWQRVLSSVLVRDDDDGRKRRRRFKAHCIDCSGGGFEGRQRSALAADAGGLIDGLDDWALDLHQPEVRFVVLLEPSARVSVGVLVAEVSAADFCDELLATHTARAERRYGFGALPSRLLRRSDWRRSFRKRAMADIRGPPQLPQFAQRFSRGPAQEALIGYLSKDSLQEKGTVDSARDCARFWRQHEALHRKERLKQQWQLWTAAMRASGGDAKAKAAASSSQQQQQEGNQEVKAGAPPEEVKGETAQVQDKELGWDPAEPPLVAALRCCAKEGFCSAEEAEAGVRRLHRAVANDWRTFLVSPLRTQVCVGCSLLHVVGSARSSRSVVLDRCGA
jgi:hypothetical protein